MIMIDRPTDRQTDHAAPAVTADRIYVRSTEMRPNINKIKLDGCIVWNAHNTVFGSKRSSICALFC